LGNDEVLLYPNPNVCVFILEFTNPTKEKVNISLFKYDGTLISADYPLSRNSYSGNFPELKIGVYFLKVDLQNNDSRTLKVFIR
tara:strand:+ start:32005 stop:32256 length:252 start_codon:yes stop_codon:yes gene_type:complete